MAVPGTKKESKQFSSTIFKSLEEDMNVFCVPCHKDGSNLAAFGYCTVCHEHMCESCFKHHKRSFLSRCHTLLDKGSMPQTQQLPSTSANTGQSEEPTKRPSVITHPKLSPVLTCSALQQQSSSPAKKRSRPPTALKQSTPQAKKRSKPPTVLKQSPSPTLKKSSPTVIKQSPFPTLKQSLSSILKKSIPTVLKQSPSPTLKKSTPPVLKQLPIVIASKSGDPSQQGEICVKTSQDEKVSWVNGMVFITPDQLVLTDVNNSCIKMVDTTSNSITARLKLSSVPWDITLVMGDELAITLPYEQTIQFISNNLTTNDTLKVNGECYGISCYQGKLVVTYRSPAKLHILDRKGIVQTTVITSCGGEQMFLLPDYVMANSSSIYVCDWGKGAVIRLNWQGRVIGTYGYLPSPRGLALIDDGCIFVRDTNRGMIQELSGDCIKAKVVLVDLNKPLALCWSGDNNKLYVSSCTWEEKHNNFLQVFDMS